MSKIQWKVGSYYAADERYGYDVKLLEDCMDEWAWRVYDGATDEYIRFGYADTAKEAKEACLRSVE